MACSSCDVIVYNLSETNKEATEKVKTYGIKALPAVAVNGKLLSCCQSKGVSEANLEPQALGSSFNIITSAI